MNIAQINELRASIGLSPLAVSPAAAAKRKQHERNKRERAEANRRIKAARASRSK